MASLLLFLGLISFMFQAGYQWHKWESGEPEAAPAKRGKKAQHPLDSMLSKI